MHTTFKKYTTMKWSGNSDTRGPFGGGMEERRAVNPNPSQRDTREGGRREGGGKRTNVKSEAGD